MTLVGKILVVLNMFAAILFLGFAAADYSAKQNLQARVATAEKAKKEAENKAVVEQATAGKLDIDNKKLMQDVARLEKEKNSQKKQADSAFGDVTKDADTYRKQADVSGQRLKQTGDEITARKAEVDQLRGIQKDLTDKYLTQQKELSDSRDTVQDLKNQLEREREKLRESEELRSGYAKYLLANNLKVPTKEDVEDLKGGIAPPPAVEGVVANVADAGKFIEISLGENDGIRRNHKLQVWTLKPTPQYKGEIVITDLWPNKAVGQPSGRMLAPVKQSDRVGVNSQILR